MSMRSLSAIATCCVGLALAQWSLDAASQSYPAKPIRLVLPVPPGGVADVAARPLAQQMTQLMGQQVVLDYRPGATGAIGIRAAATSAADGYTLLWGSTNTMCM